MRSQTAATWQEEILKGERADYGKEILATLSQQLSWSHFKEILSLKDLLQRKFYAAMCRAEDWSVRTLRKKIDSMLHDRSALSKKPEKAIRQELAGLRAEDRMTPDMVFRDPVILRQLGLAETHNEKELEVSSSEGCSRTFPAQGVLGSRSAG